VPITELVDTSYHHAASESPTFGHSHDPEKAALGGGIRMSLSSAVSSVGRSDLLISCPRSRSCRRVPEPHPEPETEEKESAAAQDRNIPGI
jgi:hypothetical protein